MKLIPRNLPFILTLFTANVSAGLLTVHKQEVDHLLVFIEESGCVVNRNGEDYPAERGVEHIESKFRYFLDDIASTEDFIRLAATKSTMSGEYYMVTCPGSQKQKTRDWLLHELTRFREMK